MKKEYNEISARIRELRDVCGYSIREMAEALQISEEVYAGYEQNGENIPISVIYEIANKCGVDFAEIVTGVGAKLNTYHIVKKGEGESISRYAGYRYEDLGFRYSGKIMQPLLVTLEPSDKPADLVSHPGQEFNLVLEGSVAVTFNGKELILNEGDSIYFNPVYPHGQKCHGDKKATFLTMIAE